MNFLCRNLIKLMIKMKLACLVLLLSLSGVQAHVWSQTSMLELSVNGKSMVEAIEMLQKKTQLKFVFNHEELNNYRVNAKIQGKTLEEALDILFSDKPLKYEITGEHVIISKTTEKQQQQPQRMTEITGVVVDENGGALNILNEWKKLYDAGYAPNVGRGGDSGLADFSSGKAAMTLGSTASLKQILQDVNGSFEVGTAYFPSITDDDKGGVSIGGASLWMLDNQDDAKKAATWEFVKYLVSAESQAYWNAQTGYFPVTTAAHDEQVFKDNIAKYPQFQTREKEI